MECVSWFETKEEALAESYYIIESLLINIKSKLCKTFNLRD